MSRFVPPSCAQAIRPLAPGNAAEALPATSIPAASATPKATATTLTRLLIRSSLLLLRLELDLRRLLGALTEVVGRRRRERRLALLAGLGRLLERLLALLGDLQRHLGGDASGD